MADILALALNPSVDISTRADRVQPTLKVRTHGQTFDPGGGGTNVARVISILGGDCDLAYFSGGQTGKLFDDLIARCRFGHHRFAIADAIRIAYMVYEEQTGFEYRFVPDGPEVKAGELEPFLRHVRAFGGKYLVASGSLPRGVPDDLYCRMAREAGSRGIRFVLDTSGPALRETLSGARVFLVKPSIRELEVHAGHSLDETGAREIAFDLVRRGAAENVAVSMGREGAILATAEGVIRVPAIRVQTVSAVGAGDSMVAAMTLRLCEGAGIGEAFRFGVAAGAAAAMTPGTELCRREDVMAIHAAMKGEEAAGPAQ